jgi:TPR repeat protein
VKAGDSSCQLNLGYCYDVGVGVKRNRQKALYWYLRAHRRGESCAASNIGTVWHDEGQLERALAWFHRAVKLGDGDANLEIALIYLRDDTKKRHAISYLAKTCKAKHVTEQSVKEASRLVKAIRRKNCNQE